MADEEKDPAAHLAAPDMSKYYYPPGTTEPVLRPEFANEASAPAAVGVITGDEEESKPLRGPLAEDFPAYGDLQAAGLTTYAKVRKQLDNIEDIDGIGPAKAEKIREAMGESSEDEEEPDSE